MLDFIVFHRSLLRKDIFQQHAERRNIPLTISQVIQELALGVVGFDFESQIKRVVRSNDTKILIEDNDRFSDRLHDSMCKYPGVLDVGELFSKHVETLAEAASYRTLSPRAQPLPKSAAS